jgi:GT2 family glycosyltransferase
MRFFTLWNVFCRALGLDSAFKRSRIFGGLMMSDFDHQTTAPVEVLNGWFLVVRRTAIDRVGLLDPEFFMYGEDVDWCCRFRESGEKIAFFADAGAIHYGGASSSNAPVRFYLEMCRANWQYWRKHHGRVAQAAFLATIAVHHGIRALGFACLYLCSPSRRPYMRMKLRRNLACLQWVGRTLTRKDSAPREVLPTVGVSRANSCE